MCSIIIVKNHLKEFPLVIAANRDEDIERKFTPVSVITDVPHLIVGGKDNKCGGSWMGVNAHSLFAAITNQGEPNSKLKSSRGSIVIDLLKCKTIDEMIQFNKNINTSKYNGFNIVFGNNKSVFLAHSHILKSIIIRELSNGVNLITSDMSFGINSDMQFKAQYIHKKLDRLTTTNWLEYYKILKSILASVEYGMRIKARKKGGKLLGHCTTSSSILAFSQDGLARYKFYDRSIERTERKEGDPFIPRYKDYIDIWRNTNEQSLSEDNDEDDSQEMVEDAFLQRVKLLKNRKN